MSQGTVMIQAQSRQMEKDFTVATPEEFVHRFGGTRVINKVRDFSGSTLFLTLHILLYIRHDPMRLHIGMCLCKEEFSR